MRLDLKENIEFPFSDPEWLPKLAKLSIYYLVSCLFLAIPLPAILGYQFEVVRQAARGEDEKLPEFGPNLGSMWVQGFLWGLAMFGIALIPIVGLGAVGFGGFMAFQENEQASMLVLCLVMLLFFAVVMVLGLLGPALILRYAMTGSISSMFDIGALINDVRQGPADYVVIALIPMAGQMVASFAGATGIGVILLFPITVLTMIIQGRMLGNYYRAYFH